MAAPSESSLRDLAWVALVALAAVVLYWPALEVGYLADDLFHMSFVDGVFPSDHPFSLYFFALDDPAATHAHAERGSLPWWTVPHWRFAHLRPLSSLLLELDYRVWPRESPWHHVHSMAWMVATVFAYHRWLRRIVPTSIAVVALVTVAWDETLVWTVAWLSNRCAMVSATFVALAMAVHVRRRADGRDAWRDRDAGLELGLWGLAFAAGEYAACGLGFVLAYELLGATGPVKARVRALAPAAVVLAVFAAVYLSLGCGVYGAQVYVDPFTDFDVFVQQSWTRMVRMIGEAWLGVPGDTEYLVARLASAELLEDSFVAGLSPEAAVGAHTRTIAWSILLLVPATWWLARREWTPAERRAVAWTTLGGVLALVPVVAVAPVTRTLLIPMFGVGVFVGAVTMAAVRSLRRRAAGLRDWGARIGLALVTVALWTQHTFIDLYAARVQLEFIQQIEFKYTHFFDTPAVRELDLEGKHVVVIASPGLVTGIHGLSTLNRLGRPLPASLHVLTMGRRALLMRRHGTHTLQIQAVGQPLHVESVERLFRNHDERLQRGDTVELSLFTARVLHTNDEGPTVVAFDFRWPLEDPRLVFLVPGPDGLRPFTLPAPGQGAAIESPAGPPPVH